MFRSVFPPNGDGEIRTHDPLLARQVLSQLSYTPIQPSLFWFLSYFLLSSFVSSADTLDNGLEWTRTIDLTLIRRAL